MLRFRDAVLAVIPAALLGGAAMHLASRGHPTVLPLDDAYIYLQYARTAAAGSPGSYVPGGPVSSGFTSPLWFGFLAAKSLGLRMAGMNPGALVWIALLADAVAAALGFWLLVRLARRHGVRGAAAGLPILLLLLMPIWDFGAMNGMETGLYGASLLAAAWTLAGGSVGWLVLPALVRPEGAVIALGVLIARRFTRAGVHDDPPAEAPGTPRRLSTLLVIASAAFTLALPYLLTGIPSAGWTAKALATEPKPGVRGFYVPRLAYFGIRSLWFGVSGGRMQPPLGVLDDLRSPGAWTVWPWALFLAGGAVLAAARARARGALVLWIPATLLALVAVAWDAQFYRYLVPAIPLVVLAATAGWFSGNAGGAAIVRRGLGGLLIVVVAVGTLFQPPGFATRFRRLYRGECEKIESNQLRTGEWIADNLPAGARVATHDVGAIAFAGERPVVDLVGLTTPALAGAYRDGEGALWEALSHLSPKDRPGYAAVIPAWMPYLSRTLLFKDKLWSAGGDAPAGRAPGRAFEVWSLAWPGVESTGWGGPDLGDVPSEGSAVAGRPDLERVDEVDVADLPSERAHDYRQDPPSLRTDVRNLDFGIPNPDGPGLASAIEGGREATGITRFTLHAHAGVSALLVLRSTATARRNLEIRVGSWTGAFFIPRTETRFSEASLLIPGSTFPEDGDGRVAVEVRGLDYRAFHWWLYQTAGAE